jgi:hypothetical protein
VSSSFGAETDSDQGVTRNESSKVEIESLQGLVTDLHAKVEKIQVEKKESLRRPLQKPEISLAHHVMH